MKESEAVNPYQDTTPGSERVRIEMLRRVPMWQRAEMLNGLIHARRVLLLADLRRRYPQADANELHKRLAARLLPRADVIRIFNWDPEEEGY